MPQVPYSTGPTVRDAPLNPAIHPRAPDVSETQLAVAGGLGAAANAADTIAQRDAQAAASQADAEITQAYLQWDVQARKQYRGQNADGYVPAAQAWWAKTAETYGQQLDPRAKALVSQSLLQKQTQAIGSAITFTGAEKERHADDMAAADIDSAIQFGVSTGGVAGAAQQVRSIVAGVGARKGWETAQVEEATVKQLSGLHLAYISSLAQNDPAAASAYFQANKAEIGAPQQARVEQVLKAETDNQIATQKAAAWATLPYAEQLAKAGDPNEISDPQVREKTLLQIKNNHGAIKEAQQERERQYSDQAWQMVGQGQRVPEAVLGAMDGRERVQLQDYLRQRAEHLATQGNAPVKTDPLLHAKLLDLLAYNPAEFAKLRMEQFAYTIAKDDLEQLNNAKLAILNPKPDRDIVSFNNKITSRIEMLGATGEKDAEKRGVFRTAAQKEFEAFTARTGKSPSPQDEDEILDRLLMPGSNPWFSGNAKTYGESLVTGKPFVPAISSSDKALIVKALKAEGLANPTDDQIAARFKLAKGLR